MVRLGFGPTMDVADPLLVWNLEVSLLRKFLVLCPPRIIPLVSLTAPGGMMNMQSSLV